MFSLVKPLFPSRAPASEKPLTFPEAVRKRNNRQKGEDRSTAEASAAQSEGGLGGSNDGIASVGGSASPSQSALDHGYFPGTADSEPPELDEDEEDEDNAVPSATKVKGNRGPMAYEVTTVSPVRLPRKQLFC